MLTGRHDNQLRNITINLELSILTWKGNDLLGKMTILFGNTIVHLVRT